VVFVLLQANEQKVWFTATKNTLVEWFYYAMFVVFWHDIKKLVSAWVIVQKWEPECIACCIDHYINILQLLPILECDLGTVYLADA
jgi:hypothetical protein